jgi:hypothetical protein
MISIRMPDSFILLRMIALHSILKDNTGQRLFCFAL